MSDTKKIKSALISVYSKEGIDLIAEACVKQNITIYSTGGTENYLKSLGIPVESVESVTSYPGILGGRVKTLHPKVFGGILNRRDHADDQKEVAEYDIPEIDLVIVDLYPFEDTLKSGASHEDIIEKIDIGGISLIRAAAKNYKDVVTASSKNEYGDVLRILIQGNGNSTELERKQLAARAFAVSSTYDRLIGDYLAGETPGFTQMLTMSMPLRYGENPHQKGIFYGDFEAMFEKLSGKELSYNNLLDVDAAVNLMSEFTDGDAAFAILKHNNACGVAVRKSLTQAYTDALAGDPISAFGGVLIANRPIDLHTATKLDELFFEVLIAPGFEDGVMELLTTSKKNRILVRILHFNIPNPQYRTALNGVLWQDRDFISDKANDFTVKTERQPTQDEIDAMVFAQKLVKQTRSNAIVLARNNQLLASGTGQTSRVDALKQAIDKAKHFGFNLEGAVMASDAFFPFPDCVEIAHSVGIKSVIQPGGSVKDQLSIDFCNLNGMVMVFTGIRHFKH